MSGKARGEDSAPEGKSVSRREFLKIAGIAGAAVGAAGGLGGLLAACGGATTTTTAATTATTAATTQTTAGATTTTGATQTTVSAGATSGPIKLGHIFNQTGPEATVGALEKTGFDAAVQAANNKIEGRPVVIINADAGGEPSTSVDAAKKLVEQDKVACIFGPTEIGQKTAVAAYCNQAQIPLILYNPSPVDIVNNNPYVFGAGGTTPQCPSCMADYLYTHKKYRTITTITEDSSAGRSFMDPLTQIFTKEGGQVLKQQWVAEDATDFAPYLTILPQADCLVAWETGSTAIAFLTQYHQLGINKKMPVAGAFHGGFLDPFVLMSMAPADAAAVVGSLAPQVWNPDSQDPVNQTFMQNFQAVTQYPPGDDASSGPAQAVMLLEAALKTTGGDTTPAKLIAALSNASFTGPQGPMSFSNSQLPVQNVYIEEIIPTPNPQNLDYLKGKFQYHTIYTYPNVPPEGFTVQ